MSLLRQKIPTLEDRAHFSNPCFRCMISKRNIERNVLQGWRNNSGGILLSVCFLLVLWINSRLKKQSEVLQFPQYLVYLDRKTILSSVPLGSQPDSEDFSKASRGIGAEASEGLAAILKRMGMPLLTALRPVLAVPSLARCLVTIHTTLLLPLNEMKRPLLESFSQSRSYLSPLIEIERLGAKNPTLFVPVN